MPRKIHDEFTDLPISRERKRQLRKMKEGKCVVASCEERLLTKDHCRIHASLDSWRGSKRYRTARPSASQQRVTRKYHNV